MFSVQEYMPGRQMEEILNKGSAIAKTVEQQNVGSRVLLSS